MPLDTRAPVILGVAQLNNRSDDVAEPVAMMVEAVQQALADAGGVSATHLDMVRVVKGIWPYTDPGALIAEQLGIAGVHTSMTAMGGNEVLDQVNDTAKRIQAGELESAIVCAAETMRTRRRDKAAGRRSPYLVEPDDAAPDEEPPDDYDMATDTEKRFGIWQPVNFYALAESALRHRLGETVAEHNVRLSSMMARASEIAAENPMAWNRQAVTAQHIATPSSTNRPVAAPYPKLMTSNINVDQAGVVVVASVAWAERHGVPRDRWVFPHSGASARDTLFVTHREAIDQAPAMGLAGRRALELGGVTSNDLKYIDLYSCFPVAVQSAQRELGFENRDFTITGSMTFAGGPMNCYSMLSLIRAVTLLREDPGEKAFVTGNGGFLTKHSFTVLGTDPAGDGYRWESAQADADVLPARAEDPDARDGELEAYTVLYDRDGAPVRAVMSLLTAGGGRRWAGSDDAALCHELLATDCVGRGVTILDNTSGDAVVNSESG